jgi:endonuclease YncB( thermonuclease family)
MRRSGANRRPSATAPAGSNSRKCAHHFFISTLRRRQVAEKSLWHHLEKRLADWRRDGDEVLIPRRCAELSAWPIVRVRGETLRSGGCPAKSPPRSAKAGWRRCIARDKQPPGTYDGRMSRLTTVGALLWLAVTAAVPLAAHNLHGRVVGVADGDTLTVLDDHHLQHTIRLNGIDAPESGQAFGQVAKRHLSTLVFGQDVLVIRDKVDRYGRLVGTVRRGETNANLEQLRAGLAWYYRQYASDVPVELRSAYASAELRPEPPSAASGTMRRHRRHGSTGIRTPLLRPGLRGGDPPMGPLSATATRTSTMCRAAWTTARSLSATGSTWILRMRRGGQAIAGRAIARRNLLPGRAARDETPCRHSTGDASQLQCQQLCL